MIIRVLATFAVLLAVACGDDGNPTDGGAPISDGGFDALIEVADASLVDAPVDATAAAACGWSNATAQFACGGSDPQPSDGTVTCTGTDCCAGMCDPSAGDRVCCDSATGVVTTIYYSGGTCETETDDCSSP